MKNLNYGFISIYIMTKTLFGKKLLLIATITVLVSGLTLAATTFDDAEAKKPKTGTFDIKCKLAGSFMTPSEDTTLGTGVSSATGKCSKMGGVSTLGTLVPTGLPFESVVGSGVDDCIGLVSSPGGAASGKAPSMIFNKKGDSILYEVTSGKTCFLDGTGAAAPVLNPKGFCKITDATDPENLVLDPLSTQFSESWQFFDVISDPTISRFQSTGAFDNAVGDGEIHSEVSHCDRTKPLANWVISTLEATITVP
jgi:hypothetical protein